MKILHTAPIAIQVSRNLKYAGTERIALALNQVYHEKGHDSFVAASGDSDLGPYGTLIPTIPECLWTTKGTERIISRSAEAYGSHYKKSLEFAVNNGIDIIHDHPGQYIITSEEYSQKKIDIPVVTTIHGGVSVVKNEKYAQFRRLQEDGAPVYFVSISDSQRKKYENLIGIRIDEMIYNGVPIDELPFKKEKQDYLLWLGRISSIKGTDLAVKVARETGRPLIIAGEVHRPFKSFYDETIAPYLTESVDSFSPAEQEIRRNSLVEKLASGMEIVKGGEILFIGPVNNSQKAILFANASGLLQPNRWDEPFGLVMAEALATGTPVIGTHAGSIPELIKHGKTGYIIEPEWINKVDTDCRVNGDIERRFNDNLMVGDLISAVESLGKINPEDCRKDAVERFSQEVMGKNYLKFYERILSSQ
jgi:glycosyltransferase involved in cell wall biosynthesis